jgi:hypothetical protein
LPHRYAPRKDGFVRRREPDLQELQKLQRFWMVQGGGLIAIPPKPGRFGCKYLFC